jgi:hypothetical protein
MKGTGDIFYVAFLGVLSNFWFFALTDDKEWEANKDV